MIGAQGDGQCGRTDQNAPSRRVMERRWWTRSGRWSPTRNAGEDAGPHDGRRVASPPASRPCERPMTAVQDFGGAPSRLGMELASEICRANRASKKRERQLDGPGRLGCVQVVEVTATAGCSPVGHPECIRANQWIRVDARTPVAIRFVPHGLLGRDDHGIAEPGTVREHPDLVAHEVAPARDRPR